MATNETYEQLQSGDPLEKLYKVVKQQGLYTKSFDEFKTKYSDRANRERLYNVIREQGLYTKSQEEFNRQYFAASEIPPLDITKVPREKAVSESTAIPKGMPRELDMSKLHKDYEERYQKQKKELTKKAVQSHEVLKNELLGNEDVLTELIKEGRYRRHAEQQLDQFAAGPRSDMPRVLPQRPEDFVNINPAAQPISEEEKIETKTAILSDPNNSRSFLKSVAAKKPEKAKEIQEAMYIADRVGELPEAPDLAADYKNQRVLKNLEGIRKGEILYDVTSGTLQKPVSFFDAVVHGSQERIRQLHGYDFANKATDQELIEHFEKQRASYDPDKPIPVYEGAASFGQMVGMEAMPMLKGGAAAALAGAATGGLGATVAAAAINTPEYYQRGYYAALEETYNQLRNEGKSPEEALQVARAQARDEGKLSAIEGIVSSAVGARWGMKSLPKPRITGGFLNATKNAILESGKFLKDITLEGLGEGLVAGYLQTEKNIKAQEKGIARMEDEGVMEAITGEMIFSLGVAGITQAGRVGLKSAKAFKNLLYHVARQPQETIDQQLGNMVADGLITQEDAEQTRQEILQQKQLDKKVPDNIRDESRQKIIEKIQQREALREQLEKTDEALQEPVRQKIEKINEEIVELSKDRKTREETKADKQLQEYLEAAEEIGTPEQFEQELDRLLSLAELEPPAAAENVQEPAAVQQTEGVMPKLGEINRENNQRPPDEDITQYTPTTILERSRQFYQGDQLIERVVNFLTPIVESNPNIRIDTKGKLDPGVLGLSHKDGRIELNFDHIKDYDTLYRTGLHELMHAATRNEIATNKAFQEELSIMLDEVRKAMKLPDNGAVISAFVARGIIDENKYGASNEYELLAEVFTNQKFYEALKNLEYKGDSVLRRIFLAIAKFFSEKYRQITKAKEQISVDNIADYLMALTESVVSAPEQSSSTDADALPLIKPVDRNRLKSLIRNTTLPDEQLIQSLVNKLGITEQEAQNLIDEARATQLPKSAIPEVPDRPQPYKSGFKKFRDKWFSSAAGLPYWILPLRGQAEGSVQLAVRRALQVVKKLKKEAAKHKFDDWEAFDNALRGDEKAYTQLPEIIQPFVVQMRAMIDGLSYQLITGGFVSQEQALNIESNIGTYLTRSYKIFNEKNWAKKVPRNVRNEAYRLLVQDAYSLIKEKNPDIDDQEAIDRAAKIGFQELEAILAGNSEKFDVGKSAVRGKDLGILKQRKEIPKEIRDLLGEYKDPGLNFVLTIARVASLKSQAEFLTKVRDMGMGTIFFKKDDVDRPAGASVPIAAEGSETWSPLNGLYTYPEVKEAFKEVEKERNFLVKIYMKAVGAVRWAKTVGSIVTQVINFDSNAGFAIMNGHYRVGKAKQSWKYLKDKLIKGEKSTDELIEKAIWLGLVGQSVGMRELKVMLQSDDIEKIALAALKEKTPIRKITNSVAKPINYLNKVYGAADDFWKIYGFLNEAESLSRARYEKSYKDLSPEEMERIDLEASERTKAFYPTYDRVVPAAKVISKYMPIFGNFISFQAEVVRNLYNTISYVKKDLKDPQLRPLGIQRLLGITAYMSARVIALHAIAQMTGVGMAGLFAFANDEEEEQKLNDINRYVPSFMRSADKLARYDGDGVYMVYNAAALDPYAVIFRAMNALTSGGQDVEEPGLWAAIKEFLNPFTEYEILFGAWIDIEKNEDWRGRPISHDADPLGDQFIDRLSYMLEMAKPSTIGFLERLFSREDKMNELAALFGGKGYKVDVTKGFSYKLKDRTKEVAGAKADYYSRLKNASEEEKERLKEKYNRRMEAIGKKLHEDYQAAIRLGGDVSAMNKMIRENRNYERKLKRAILTGIYED